MIEENTNVTVTKKTKKSKTGLIAFITLIAGLLIGVGGSYYYFEVMTKDSNTIKSSSEKEDKNSKTEDTSVEISADSLYIKELIENYDNYYISNTEIYDSLYTKDKTTLADLSEEYLRAITMRKANKNITGFLFITGEEFQNAATKLFGNQVTLENKAFSIAGGCTSYEYDGNYTIAPTQGRCGGTSAVNLSRKIVNAVKQDSKLEVIVAIALENGMDNKVYKGFDNKQLSNEIVGVSADSFNISEHIDKLNQYKYTFTYDTTNDGYILNAIELIK